MNMVPVSSSNLVSVGYDPATQTLRVQFKLGCYDYTGVPESVYRGLLGAPSKGEYHAARIKYSFPYRRIG
ncbi:KTSC domain-containing protein [bacterium]|nr:MAG: KTSC domain-containing protein [bacterium]